MNLDLHQRIAKVLGWTVEGTHKFNLITNGRLPRCNN